MCVCVCVQGIQSYNYIIIIGFFYVYIFVDLLMHNLLTLARYSTIKMTTIIVIIKPPNFTFLGG